MTKLKEAVSPIIFTSAIFGLSSIFFYNGQLKIYNTLKYLTLVYLSMYSYLMYAAFGSNENVQFKANYAAGVTKLGLIFQVITQVSLLFSTYLISLTKSEQLLKTIECFAQNEEIFKDLGIKPNYRGHFKYEVLVITFGLAVLLARNILSFNYFRTHIVEINAVTYILLMFPATLLFLIQTKFALFVSLLWERFSLINKQLYLLVEQKKEKAVMLPYNLIVKINKNHAIKRVELLMELHDVLTDVGTEINNNLTMQVVCCFTSQFLTIVFTIFYLYYESLVLKNVWAAFQWLLWAIFTVFEIIHITINCHLTANESKNTGIVLHKFLMEETDPILQDKLIVFSQQVSHRPLGFSGCGLFVIDATLIFTIIGAAATYLLIMLQFQEGIEAQCSAG